MSILQPIRDAECFEEVTCPDCGGDGIAVCRNPDHGFITAMGGDIGRLGCPVCGHSEDGKLPGEACDTCDGAGKTTRAKARAFLDGTKIQ